MEARRPSNKKKDTVAPESKPSVGYTADNLPTLIPILPLYEAALFPKMVLPLVVMQGESIKLVDEAMSRNRIIGLVVSASRRMCAPTRTARTWPNRLQRLDPQDGQNEDNRAQMLVQGLTRFGQALCGRQTLPAGRSGALRGYRAQNDETSALMANLIKQFARMVELVARPAPEIGQMAASIKEPGTLADMIASTINSSPEEKQSMLELQDATKRLKLVTKLDQPPAGISWSWATRSRARSRATWTSANANTTCASSSRPSGRAG
jgi:ATP-dependent Lon protease